MATLADGIDPATRYNAGARTFHAAIAVLVIANLALGLLHESLPKDWNVMPLHKSIGLIVLVLGVARLLWRLTWTTPAYAIPLGRWTRAAARAMHWGLYALMVIMPLTGWIFSSAGKYPLAFYPWPRLPVHKGDLLADFAHESHEILGYLMAVLVVGHVVAALRHHFILRDGVLRRMW